MTMMKGEREELAKLIRPPQKRRARKRHERKRLQWVQYHAEALAEQTGGVIHDEDLKRRLCADLEAHPELIEFLGIDPVETLLGVPGNDDEGE